MTERDEREQACQDLHHSRAISPYLWRIRPTLSSTLRPVIRVRLFAGPARAGGLVASASSTASRRSPTSGPRSASATSPAGLLYAVNREYADREQELADGDEVALIPPVSGGAFRLTEEPLSLEAVAAEVADERAGAIATFIGHGAPPVTRPRGDATRVRGLREHGRGRDGAARRGAAGSATSSARSRSTTASACSGSARRAW